MSCRQEVTPEMFLDKCNETELELINGIEVTDSLGHFSFRVPDITWQPMKFLNDKENGLVVSDTSEGYIRVFSVNQSNYTYDWNWEEEQKNVEKYFTVLESGELNLNGRKYKYNIVLDEDSSPKLASLFVTFLDTVEKRNYTLELMTENAKDYKSRFCTMKPILESFKIKTNANNR